MSEVSVKVDEGVALLTLEAGDRRNALTFEMAEEMLAACEQIDADESIGAVVVRGSQGYFCAGAHRSTLAGAGADPAEPELYRQMGSVYGSFARVGELKPPVIAAVLGGAVGAGLNLLLAADLRIVAEDAKITSGFLRLGIHPGGGHFTILNRVAGRETTAALGLFGETVSGTEAAELGLAWEALPADQVEARAIELAKRPAADPELARRVAKSMRSQIGPPGVSWPVALDSERASQMWSLRRNPNLT